MSSNRVSRRGAMLTGLAGALTYAVVVTGCDQATPTAATVSGPFSPRHTVSSGSQSTLLGRATFDTPCVDRRDHHGRDGRDDHLGSHPVADPCEPGFQVKRISDGWRAEVKADPRLDIAVQRIVFQPGGQSGWHRHPGPVFIEVVVGTMTFYESDDPGCTPIVRSAGQGYLDVGEHAHIARNESGEVAENVVVYLAPEAATLRIDAPDPGNCAF
jgi:hypothetical protein